MILLRLFFEFFKVGLFAVGGGLATLPFLSELSASTGWFSPAELADMVAVSESTPGPIGVNMATYVGYTAHGVLGAIVAVLGIITPSVIIIIIIAGILEKFRTSTVVDSIFKGLRPASLAMISAAGLEVARISLLDIEGYKASGSFTDLISIKGFILAAALFVVLRRFKGKPIFYILASAVIGIVFKLGT
ncbi:MAG: chromate transporter [Oscillospiraceae bacterium]|nr:chromate transporter [Oscillospiraceae bacterium]